MKEENDKVGLKLNIQKTKIMASGSITSWEIDGKQWKQQQTLHFWAPKSLQMVIAAMKLKDTYSWERRNTMANLHSMLRTRDITLSTNVRLVKAMVFLAVRYGYETWNIKKTEH